MQSTKPKERSKSQKASYYKTSFLWSVQNRQISRDRKQIGGFQELGVEEIESKCVSAFLLRWWKCLESSSRDGCITCEETEITESYTLKRWNSMVCEFYLNKKCLYQNSLFSWHAPWPRLPLKIFSLPLWLKNQAHQTSSPPSLATQPLSDCRESPDHPQATTSILELEANPSFLTTEAFLSLPKCDQGSPLYQKQMNLQTHKGPPHACLPSELLVSPKDIKMRAPYPVPPSHLPISPTSQHTAAATHPAPPSPVCSKIQRLTANLWCPFRFHPISL